MPLTGYVGYAQALDAREAGSQAALKAVEQLGRNPVGLGIIIASHALPIQQVLSGASALLGDAPLIGFSTTSELTAEGRQQYSVLVAVLSSGEFTARADWWANFADDSRGAAQKMVQALQLRQAAGSLLICADGLSGDIKDLCASLPEGNYTLAGCLAGGDLQQGYTFQIGGRQSGNGGLAAAFLSGNIQCGVGIGHGWQPVGLYFPVTATKSAHILSLNDQPVAEIYSQTYGYPASDWSYPPLSELIRLYPLGIEQGGSRQLLIRSPLTMEIDGGLRMHTMVPQGSIAHMMVGSAENCLKAVRSAAEQAMTELKGARPALGLVFVDTAWQNLLEARAGSEMHIIREVLGEDVPLLGGYVFGQLARLQSQDARAGRPELFNQSIEVVVFGEPAAG